MYVWLLQMGMGSAYGGGRGYEGGPGKWGNVVPPQPPMPRVNALLARDTPSHDGEEGGAPRPPVPPGQPPPADVSDGYPMRGEGAGGAWSQSQSHGQSEDKCTVHCTGIPPFAKELELYSHFVKFGKIARLYLRRLADEAPAGPHQGKVYNECMVQFVEAESCRKCLNSPSSVLGNRFIKLFPASHNLIPLDEVEEVLQGGAEVYEGALHDQAEGLWASIEGGGGRGRGRGGDRGRGRGRGGRGWASAPTPSSYSRDQSQGEAVNGGGQSGGGNEGSAGEAPRKTHAQLEKERLRGMVLQQHNDLRSLRQQAESIWRKKEDLLQVGRKNG